MFLLRSLFWLGLVFLALPLGGMDLVSGWRQAADHALDEAKDQARQTAAQQAQDWCLKDPATCVKNAAEAADLLGLLPKTESKGASQDTLRPTDLQPAWRGHEKPRASRG